MGVIMGTAAYMSPEQAKGKTADRRADIWAFGAVLYEMLTGRRAFLGETVSDVLAKVLEREPDFDGLPDKTPTEVRRLLRRCLDRTHKRRLHDIGDALPDLEGSLAPSQSDVALVAPPAHPSRVGQIVRYALTAAAAAAVAGLLVWSLRGEAPRTPRRLAITFPASVDLVTNPGPVLALSRDGSQLAYVGSEEGRDQLYLRSMGTFEISQINGTEGARSPFFSPDADWIGFVADGKLKKVSLAGGPAVTLCDAPGNPRGASWAPDDTIVFGLTGSGLWQVSADGGTPTPLTTPNSEAGETEHRWPEVLPDGRAALFTVWSGSLRAASVALVSLETGEQRTLTDGTSPRYASSGHIVFARPGSLWAIPFDARRLDTQGSPVPLIEDLQVNSGGAAHFTIGSDGSIVYMPVTAATERVVVWVDRDGRTSPLMTERGRHLHPRFSPDGERIALATGSEAGDLDIWLFDIARGFRTRLTTGGGTNWLPTWTPDGSRVTYTWEGNIYWTPADQSGEPEPLLVTEDYLRPGSWDPSGQLLAFARSSAVTGRDIWVLDRENGPSAVVATTFEERAPVFSPDGRLLAYVSDESGQDEVYVQPYPGGGERFPVSIGGGVAPVWSPNGSELFYRRGDQVMSVPVQTDPVFSAATPQRLFAGRFDLDGALDTPNYDISPDGERFVMVNRGQYAIASQLHVIVNWFEELKRLVPTP